jgi:hypothetical protein
MILLLLNRARLLQGFQITPFDQDQEHDQDQDKRHAASKFGAFNPSTQDRFCGEASNEVPT